MKMGMINEVKLEKGTVKNIGGLKLGKREKPRKNSKNRKLVHNCRIEREKFYPGPGLEPGHLAFRANALPLSYPGQVRVHDRINLTHQQHITL